jgi:geranylgeranyl reductase family protein
MKTDVVIIGAGPAGGMAACRLAAGGLRVLLLEARKLPRAKPCGGALTSPVDHFIDWDFSPVVEREVFAVRYLFNYGEAKFVENEKTPMIRMVNRSRFDHHLIERALEIGPGNVEVRDGFRVTGVEERDDLAVVYGQKDEKIYAPYVIGADGALGITAGSLGLHHGRAFGSAISVRVRVPRDVFEKEKRRATFNLCCFEMGGGWLFPKDGYLSCGIGCWEPGKKLVTELKTFLEKSFIGGNIRTDEISPFPIPIYQGNRPIATRRVCLVGDAAGLVDPIMGEGIRYALESGTVAADAIRALMEGKVPPMKDSGGKGLESSYQPRIHRGVGRELELVSQLALPIFKKSPLYFYRQFIGEGRSYGDLAHGLARKLYAFQGDPSNRREL